MRRALPLLLVLACDEHFPDPQIPAPPAAGPVLGLDARPVATTCVARPKPAPSTTDIAFERASPVTFEMPVEIVRREAELYVLEQAGRVRRLDGSVALDVSAEIVAGGEAGLLGMAFHPRFAENGFVFFYVTVPGGAVFESALVRYHSSDAGLTFEPASATRVLTVDQPFSNHNGGTIAFGPDGLLYWGLGDGGSAGDPGGRAQDPASLHGKMLRIAVDTLPYGIPEGNPFASGGGRPEIYALGFRNPFRFRFDPREGTLWLGDVGQSNREEIDRVVLGGNYGWNVREGKVCYPETAACGTTGFVDPVVDHPRSEASSITGGVVYRGVGVPLVSGTYVYGDFNSGLLWSLPIDTPAPVPRRLEVGSAIVHPSAFATDVNGEIVLTDYVSGQVLRIVSGGTLTPPEMPERLADTGCLDPAGVFPYDVNVPQSGVVAERALSMPDAPITVSDAGHLVLPEGSVVLRTVRAEGQRVETQLLARRAEGWSAYTYAWSGEEARLATAEMDVPLPSGKSHHVDPTTCTACHRAGPIGLEPAQLDREGVRYGERLANPLATLESLGMIPAPAPYARLPAGRDVASAEVLARAHIHANCSFCHRDLSFTSPRFCPDRVLSRLVAEGRDRMPPVGPRDAQGIALVTAWAEAGCQP